MIWLAGQSILRRRAACPDLHGELRDPKIGLTALKQEDYVEVEDPMATPKVPLKPHCWPKGREAVGRRAREWRVVLPHTLQRPYTAPGTKVPCLPLLYRTLPPPEESPVPSGESKPKQSPADPRASFSSLSCHCLGQIPWWMRLVPQEPQPQNQNRKENDLELLTGSPVSVDCKCRRNVQTQTVAATREDFWMDGVPQTRPMGTAARMRCI